MKTFTESASNVLDIATEVLADVDLQLTALLPGCKLNVKEYSEKMAAKHGWDPLFVATLIRTVVKESDEYESFRGRNGGVARVYKTKVRNAPVTLEQAAEPKAENVPTQVDNNYASFIGTVSELLADKPEVAQVPAEPENPLFADCFETTDEFLANLAAAE